MALSLEKQVENTVASRGVQVSEYVSADATVSLNDISDVFDFSSTFVEFNWKHKSNNLLRSIVRHALNISVFKLGVFEAAIAVSSLHIARFFGLHSQLEAIVFYAVGVFAFLTTLVMGLNERRNYKNIARLLSAQAAYVGITVLLLAVFSNVIILDHVGRRVFAAFTIIYGIASLLPKLAIYSMAARSIEKVLWVGSKAQAEYFNETLSKHGEHYRLVGYWDGRLPDMSMDDPHGYMCSLYKSLDVDQIVLSKQAAESDNLLSYCYKAAQAGCTIVDECTFMEEAFEQVPVEQINESWFFRSQITVNGHFQDISKRVIDIIVSLMVMTLLLPTFIAVWIAVRITGGKSVFFTQERMGQFGVPFKMYKFRTMTVGSENKKGWTQKSDIRITKIGKFLRRTRLDELPQFWNVLKGDMSVVGPRPEIPELVSVIENDVPYFSFRCWSRPGITGMAQIRYRYCADISDAREKLRYDLYYIKNWSILMDIQIMLRTVTALMRGSR